MKKMILFAAILVASLSTKAQTQVVQSLTYIEDVRELNSEYFLFSKTLSDYVKANQIKNVDEFVSSLLKQTKESNVVMNRFFVFQKKLEAVKGKYDLNKMAKLLPMCSITCGVYTGVCMSNCNQYPMGSSQYVSCMGPCIYYSNLCSDFCTQFPNGTPPPPPPPPPPPSMP